MVTIRELREDDSLEAVSAIYARSWREAYRGIVPQGYLDRLEDGFWLSTLEARRVDSLVAEADGVLAGTVCAGPGRDGRWWDWGEIVALYLLPDYQRRGIGTLLLEAAMGRLRQLGFANTYLWAAEGNLPARRFYEARGFVPAPERTRTVLDGKAVREVRYIRTQQTRDARRERHDDCPAGK